MSIKLCKLYWHQFGRSLLKTVLYCQYDSYSKALEPMKNWLCQHDDDWLQFLLMFFLPFWFQLEPSSHNSMYHSQLGLLGTSHSWKAHPLAVLQGKITSSYPNKTSSLMPIRTPQMSISTYCLFHEHLFLHTFNLWRLRLGSTATCTPPSPHRSHLIPSPARNQVMLNG